MSILSPVAGSSAFMRCAGAIWEAVGGPRQALERLAVQGEGALPSVFPVSDLAAASVGVAGLAVSELIGLAGAAAPPVRVDRRLASFWFGTTLRPQGWELPPLWDSVAGDYRAADGWIRLHTNAPHHRAAALAVLGAPADRAAVAEAVVRWEAGALESVVVGQGGCAAAMHSQQAWAAHPQGRAVQAEPLLHWTEAALSQPMPAPRAWRPVPGRLLQGVRVLDLTRILAGPTATRFLAGCGAEVLRIDPPGWDEPGTVPEVTLGKRCARLDLATPGDRAAFERLLAQADVLVHGYRPGALEGLGLGAVWRRRVNPGLVDVSLCAYGWSGPWRERRGFDSLVQMSAGIADAGMRAWARERPTPLPVQALDHATGYLLAASAVMGLARRWRDGVGCEVRASLARTAHLLVQGGLADGAAPALAAETVGDLAPGAEATSWGAARRVAAPVTVEGAPLRWERPAGALGTAPAAW